MLKAGKYRAFRNLPVGWILHAIHSTDRSETIFRIIIEGLIMVILYFLFGLREAVKYSIPEKLIYSFIIAHSIMWLLDGNFWVYFLDSFDFVRNPGIKKIILFINLAKKFFTKDQICEYIFIYGSFCRQEFHDRSDYILRIVRRVDNWKGLICLPVGMLLRIYSFFIRLPVDLQVVDSILFLEKQMRRDEKPIVVYNRKEIGCIPNAIKFYDIEQNPKIIFAKSRDNN